MEKKAKYYVLTNYDIFMPTELHTMIRAEDRRTAKTYEEKAPHAYVIEGKAKDRGTFEQMDRYIQSNGYIEYYYRTPYRYLRFGKYKYRSMDCSGGRIINRALSQKIYQ